MRLLLRLYDPNDGSVAIDGQDLRGVTRQSPQERPAYVEKNTFLCATTVREDIRMCRRSASDADEEAVARAAEADVFISTLPQVYDTRVGENGVLRQVTKDNACPSPVPL